MTQFTSLNDHPELLEDKRTSRRYSSFKKLIEEAGKFDLKAEVIGTIDQQIELVNASSNDFKSYRAALKKAQRRSIDVLIKKAKLVPKGYYRNLWIGIGMAAFGIPMGVAFGMSMDNMGLIGLGLPIGMAIGIAVGMSMDNQAAEKGRQLDVTIEV